MLLKDYLIKDDLSSCSSNGFKSFPRRQCCTAVRFDLLEKDLQAKRNWLLRPTSSICHQSSCSFKVASSTISALHKASSAVINVVKLLPFPSISPMPSSSSSYRKKNNSMKCQKWGGSNGNSWASSSEFTWEILRSTTSDNNSDVGVVSSSDNTV